MKQTKQTNNVISTVLTGITSLVKASLVLSSLTHGSSDAFSPPTHRELIAGEGLESLDVSSETSVVYGYTARAATSNPENNDYDIINSYTSKTNSNIIKDINKTNESNNNN